MLSSLARASHTLLQWLPVRSRAVAPRASSQPFFDELVARSAAKAEAAISVCRCVVALSVLVRFQMIEENSLGSGLARARIELPVLIGTVLMSLVFVRLAVLRPLSVNRFTHASVLLDVCACSAALLPGVLHPWSGYRGLLLTADVAAIPVLCAAAGLRFSLSAAWFGACANILCFSGLVALDRARNAQLVDYDTPDVVLYAIYLLGASVLGVVLATRGSKLAEQAAHHARRAESARHGLLQSLRDSHDAGSLLSAARIHADLLQRHAGSGVHEPLAASVRALGTALEQLAEVVSRGRQNAQLNVSETEPHERFALVATVRTAVERAALRFPQAQLEVVCPDIDLWLVGGARAMISIVHNLLVNACEGDGTRAGAHVRVEGEVRARTVTLSVLDDGPGFCSAMLADPRHATSSKPSGAGVGLYVVSRIVAANGGRVSLSNQPRGGARVSIELPQDALP
jgi:signal transduction histidine kinase